MQRRDFLTGIGAVAAQGVQIVKLKDLPEPEGQIGRCPIHGVAGIEIGGLVVGSSEKGEEEDLPGIELIYGDRVMRCPKCGLLFVKQVGEEA